MLVLSRKNEESVVVGAPDQLERWLEVKVLEIRGGSVKLGFKAAANVAVHRREVWERDCPADRRSCSTNGASVGAAGGIAKEHRHGAAEAELAGKRLLCRAVGRFARNAGITPGEAREVLESLSPRGARVGHETNRADYP